MSKMIPGIGSSLANILSHLQRLNRPVVGLLNGGLPSSKVRKLFSAADLDAHDDVIELYGHLDGTKVAKGASLDDIHFFPGFYLLSTEDAFNTYSAFCSDQRWGRSWFPIFGNGGGDFYAVISDRTSTGFGGVINFIVGESAHEVEYRNLASMLHAVSLCYDREVYFSRDGYLEANDLAAIQIANEIRCDGH